MELLKNADMIKNYVETVGFALSVGVKGVSVNNLWDITINPDWGTTIGPWMDELIIKREIVYPLILKNKTAVMSKEFFKYFYCLRSKKINLINNSADYYYKSGVLSKESYKILQALEYGPKGVKELRILSSTDYPEGRKIFDKAMLNLKKNLLIVKSDTEGGAWGENIFSLTHITFEEETKEAIELDEALCVKKILYQYLKQHCYSTERQLSSLFSIDKENVKGALDNLIVQNKIRKEIAYPEDKKLEKIYYAVM